MLTKELVSYDVNKYIADSLVSDLDVPITTAWAPTTL
jgi:hypothetical protein